MTRQPKYSPEEHARLGEQIYESKVRAAVEAGNRGRIVAIDVDSGQFELADNVLDACQRLISRLPESQIWCVRIGHRAVHRFGPRVMRTRS